MNCDVINLLGPLLDNYGPKEISLHDQSKSFLENDSNPGDCGLFRVFSSCGQRSTQIQTSPQPGSRKKEGCETYWDWYRCWRRSWCADWREKRRINWCGRWSGRWHCLPLPQEASVSTSTSQTLNHFFLQSLIA